MKKGRQKQTDLLKISSDSEPRACELALCSQGWASQMALELGLLCLGEMPKDHSEG